MSNYPDDFKGTNMDDHSEKVDTRNEDEIITTRLDAKKRVEEMMSNAHPDSILGCMSRIKALADKINDEKVERRV